MESHSKDANKEKRATPSVSACLADGRMIELVYDPDQRRTAFAVWENGTWRIERAIDVGVGEKLVPFSPSNNLIKNEIVLLPTKPVEYGTEYQLLSEVRAFIHRYVDVRPGFEMIASYYVLLTWLYDAFNEVPYLRLRGDWGSGKTRTLMTLGSICYKAFFASGASSVSPIFHILDAFGGTFVFDEANFRFSDEKAEIVKILNNGNVRGMPILRTMMNRQREFNPRAFRVFGPKLVATRRSYDDRGLESRFLTEDMGPRPLRPDIPINLPTSFSAEARELRNKLLLYRFRHLSDTTLDASLADPKLEPRLNQILLPLLSIVREPALRDELRSVAADAQASLIAERGLSIEAQVLEMTADLMAATKNRQSVPVADIAAGLTKHYGPEYERPITNRWVGGVLRNRLNVRTLKSHGIYVVPITERSKIEGLCARYGLESRRVDVGTSGMA
jgi:hypothetical protein